jgi:peptide subunit release factor 1 (eRF1)
MQATLAAANAGQVHLLIMNRDLTRHGWRCLDCDSLGEAQPPACPACGGSLTTIELGEALVSRCLQTDAFVELIEPDARLAAYEGVGALLRYK